MIDLRNKFLWQDTNFYLLLIAGLLTALNWYLTKYNINYLMFWYAAFYLTWRDRNKYSFDSNLFSTTIGFFLIFWILLRTIFLSNSYSDVLTRIYPLVSVLGVFLLSTKITKINQYWREITIVSFTGIPFEHIFNWLDPTSSVAVLDAKVSRLILWYLGFNVTQTDNLVFLPTGSIKIAGTCSSFGLLWLLWQFWLVVYLCFDLKKSQKILLGAWATIIALVVNGIRLCLLALLVANNQQEAFEYWHGSSGAEIFTTTAILLFALVYWFLTRPKKEQKQISNLYSSPKSFLETETTNDK